MSYGHFSSDGREYIITNPDTPRPWINYLTNENYCSIISQCAGGYSFYKDCRTNRITRWLPENWHFDRPGKYIFVRDGQTETRVAREWVFTVAEIRRMLERAGFSVLDLYGSVNCEPYKLGSQELLIVSEARP